RRSRPASSSPRPRRRAGRIRWRAPSAPASRATRAYSCAVARGGADVDPEEVVADAELIAVLQRVLGVDLHERSVRRAEIVQHVACTLAADGRVAARHEDVFGEGPITHLAAERDLVSNEVE